MKKRRARAGTKHRFRVDVRKRRKKSGAAHGRLLLPPKKGQCAGQEGATGDQNGAGGGGAARPPRPLGRRAAPSARAMGQGEAHVCFVDVVGLVDDRLESIKVSVLAGLVERLDGHGGEGDAQRGREAGRFRRSLRLWPAHA